eukprot:Gb_16369 [translate_table: standard]
MDGVGSALLEEWLQNAAAASSSSLTSSSTSLPTAREIAHSWSNLRDCLQKKALEADHLISLQKLYHCRRSLHVADPQAKLLLSLLSSFDLSGDPYTLSQVRCLASLILSAWARKSSASKANHRLFDSAVEIACKLIENHDQHKLFVCEGILLMGSLSAAPNVSEHCRKLCLDVVAELLQKEQKAIMSQGRIAEVLAGVGYAMFSCSHGFHFQSILVSLLSLWTAEDGLYTCITHGLMVLHLLEWVVLNLVLSGSRGTVSVVEKLKVVSNEFPIIAKRRVAALDFAVVMAAAGVLRACNKNSKSDQLPNKNATVEQLKSSMEEIIVDVAENAVLNFTPMGERQGHSNSATDFSQFAKWVLKNDGSLAPARKLILQCVAVAVCRCGGISSHVIIVLSLVAALLTETFPLQLMYSVKMIHIPSIGYSGEVDELGNHVGSVLFKEAGITTRAMCNQYLSANSDLKQLVEDLMWGYSQALYQKHRLFMITLKSEGRNYNSNHSLEKITEAAFFMIVMFFSIATKDKLAMSNSCSAQESVSVKALDALSCVECFRHAQLPEYSDMVKHTVSCTSKSASACAALVHLLPSYHELTHWPGALNSGPVDYCWFKDEVQTTRIFFYLRVLPTCMEKISDSLFAMDVAPLMFLYMQHPDENVARGSHSVFVAFMSAKNSGSGSSDVEERVKTTLKEQLVVYYLQRALEAYPGSTPFEGLSSGVVALVQHLPAGSPAILHCINTLVEKTSNLCSTYFTSNRGQVNVNRETESAKQLQVLLQHLILLVDIQVLPDLLKHLAQLIIGLPEYARNMALGETYDLVAGSDDVTRKPILVPWLQSLSFICSQLNSGDNKSKENSASVVKSTERSGGVSLNPTCEKHLVELSRL